MTFFCTSLSFNLELCHFVNLLFYEGAKKVTIRLDKTMGTTLVEASYELGYLKVRLGKERKG